MKNLILLGILFAVSTVSCSVSQKGGKTSISPYGYPQSAGYSALVYGLPQTRLYFEVELVQTIIKKGPYAAYADRLLGLQNVPAKDSESWQIKSINIKNKPEIDNKQLYAVSFTDYPFNIDKLLRFTREGLLLDATVSNVLMNSQPSVKNNGDFQFINTAVQTTYTEQVDTFYKPILTDTAFVRIPVLQRKVLGKTAEEQAREAAAQIFNIRQSRLDILTGNVDTPEGVALKLILQSLDFQEEQLLSLFNGARIESHHIGTYSAVPDKPAITAPLFYFSDRSGIVDKNTAGAKEVWYAIGKIAAAMTATPNQQATDIVYYRIPQVVEISAGIDKTAMVKEYQAIYQFGSMVSFPLVVPQNK